MYKLLFVVVLAAASFAGGAAVHSQGPRWAKELIQSQLGGDEADGPTVEEVQGAGDPPIEGETLSEPLAPLAIEPTPLRGPAKPAAATPAPDASNGHEARTLPVPEPKAPEPLDPRALGLGDGPSAMKPPAPLAEAQAPPLLPSPVPPADGPPILEAPAGLLRPKDREPAGRDDRGGDSGPPVSTPPLAGPDRAGGDPAAPPSVPAPEPPAPAIDAEAPPKPPANWAELRRSMRALGVSRFVIEGEPGGRVRFHCLIPVAGSRAVAQHFEAEADDELQAAEVALRRVTLWRATESPGP